MKKIEQAIKDGTAKQLTLECIPHLIGKKIQTKYYGYQGQDGIDEFIVDKLVLSHSLWGNQSPEYHKEQAFKNPSDYFYNMALLGANNYVTNINGNARSNISNMWCSDSDRYVLYIEIEQKSGLGKEE